MTNQNEFNRKVFLGAATALTAASASGTDDAIPIIDTHLHLYHPTRPQGVPYPPGPNPPQALPHQYREDVIPLGITGSLTHRMSLVLQVVGFIDTSSVRFAL